MEFSSFLWESWFAMEFTFLEEECITEEFLTLEDIFGLLCGFCLQNVSTKEDISL